jgi:two-component system CheB/CheR fusion protein
MPQQEPPAKILDPAASDDSSENARNGARKRRDPNEPVAVVGIGASAGGIAPLQEFFAAMDAQSGLAFVVVMHLSPDFESQLASVLQHKTSMPVMQVNAPVKVQPNHVYVIPPNHQLTINDGTLDIVDPQQARGRRVTIDLFLRTLAMGYGQRAVCVILSGSDSDGVIGLKHIRAQGGLTIAQDPNEAEYRSMPASVIATGMVDWVLPVAQLAPKLLEFVQNENRMHLPPEDPEADEPDAKVQDAPGGESVSDETHDRRDEEAIVHVLDALRAQTGHDFTHYKRATILRRIARRLQVHSLETIPAYLEFMRTHAHEARALLDDLLIGVTHFFRDRDAFATLETHIPQLFAGKKAESDLRVWVPACSTGEEAYSLAILLEEHCRRLEKPPRIQIFATDIDEQSIAEARDAFYPDMIQVDVSTERLREYFVADGGGYRVRKVIREKVLFAAHNLLSDAPFTRCDLISCRNLLIYLKTTAQEQVFDLFHFALRSGGLLFLGTAETQGKGESLFSAVDAASRLFVRRSTPRPAWKVPVLPLRAGGEKPRAAAVGVPVRPLRALSHSRATDASALSPTFPEAGQSRRELLFGELHLRLLEEYGPPSVVVNDALEIVHLSGSAGRYLQFVAGEPSAHVAKVVRPELEIELRTGLFKASQTLEPVITPPKRVDFDGTSEVITLTIRPMKAGDQAQGFFLVLFEKAGEAPGGAMDEATAHAVMSRDANDEINFLKEQLSSTVEQYEAGHEELKSSNEELQAANEELRSTSEELETSGEELQSVNEELVTVNSELKSSLDELGRANSDLNNLMASSDIGTIFLDRDQRIYRFTPAARKIFNLIPSDVGRPIADITSKLKYGEFMADIERVLEDLHRIEREVQSGDGTWFLIRIAPYRTDEDRIAGVVVTLIDLTQLKQAQAEVRAISHQMEAREHRFETIMEAVPDFVYEFDLEGRFTFVNASLLRLWGLKTEEAIGKNFHELDYPPELATKLQRQIQEVIDTRQSLQDETPYTSQIGERMYEYLFFPLLDEGGKVEAVAGVTRDITARRRAESDLRASEERLQRMVNVAHVGVMTFDRAGVIRHANDALLEMLGYNRDEFEKQTMTWRDFTPPEHMAASMKIMEQLRETGRGGPYEKEYFRKDGTRKWMMFVGADLGDGTAVKYAIDISDRKRAEEAQRASEERVRTISDNVPQLIWTNDAEGRANYFNKRWFEYSGLSYDESYGLGWQAMVHPEDAPAAVERWKQALAKGEVFDAEYRLRGADGEYRWFIGRNVPLKHGDAGIFSWFGSATDINELKEAEKALRSTEERFRLLVEGAKDYAMFLLDLDNRITFWSNGAQRVFGWTEAEAVGQTGALIFIPEDIKKGAVEEEIAIAMNKGRAPDRRWHLRKDGSRIWVDGVMTRIDDANGAPRGLAKIARDATDLREAEDELRHARDEMEQRVIERTQDLLATNTELERTMAQRQQLERELLAISEREKRRIGEDLHDMVCQELTATALYLKSSAKQLTKECPPASATLDEAAQTVNRNVVVARELARGLQAVELTASGLKNALRDLAAHASENRGIKCHFKAARGVRVPDDAVALHLYRIAQEAVTNAVKHSGAKNLLISLDRNPTHTCVSVSDDGKGFVMKKRGKGLGLHMMRYRANALGGELKVQRRRTGGMEITCVIPTKV